MNPGPDLRTLIEFASTAMERIFAREGQIRPLWHGITRAGEHRVYHSPPQDKDATALLMRAWFELEDIVRVVFVCEAWTFDGANKGVEENQKVLAWLEAGNTLEQYPGRVEALTFTGEDVEAGQMTAHRRIIRGSGKPKLAPLEYLPMEGWSSEGRFIGMLPRPKAKATQ